MALKVYSGVKGIEKPEYDYSYDPNATPEERRAKYEAEDRADEQYVIDLCAAAIRNQKGISHIVGRTVSFPVADGFAQYVVWSEKPLALVHVDLGDGYRFPYIERLTLKDIKQEIQAVDDLKYLFQTAGKESGVDKS